MCIRCWKERLKKDGSGGGSLLGRLGVDNEDRVPDPQSLGVWSSTGSYVSVGTLVLEDLYSPLSELVPISDHLGMGAGWLSHYFRLL